MASSTTQSASSRITKIRPLGPKDEIAPGRAWQSKPHPTLPFLATARDKDIIIYSLTTGEEHSRLTQGHTRSVRSVTWKPDAPAHRLCLASGSFDATAGIWQMKQAPLETQVFSGSARKDDYYENDGDDDDDDDRDGPWDLEIVLEGHESEIKSLDFSPSGQYLASCSRDKTVWIWEHIGVDEDDEEWECVAVLNEHNGDVKSVAWCPTDTPEQQQQQQQRPGRYSSDVLASASYDNTVRIWREDSDNEWVCVAVLEEHEGTVWGVQWEPRPRHGGFPRLLTWSADCTIRVWTLKEEEEEDGNAAGEAAASHHHAWSGLGGGIPNTMRQSLKEEWECTAVLPRAHTRDIYSASWSAESGLIASTGSDSIVAIYREEDSDEANQESTQGGGAAATAAAAAAARDLTEEEVAAELDGDDVSMVNRDGGPTRTTRAAAAKPKKKKWTLVSSTPNGHGPYEINHVIWSRRFDKTQQQQQQQQNLPAAAASASAPPPPASEGGVEEMLVTTGDDGTIHTWEVRLGG